MVNDPTYFRARCDEMRKAASETDLTQVRERCERAAAAFEKLADQALRNEQAREKTREKEAERRAAIVLNGADASTRVTADGATVQP